VHASESPLKTAGEEPASIGEVPLWDCLAVKCSCAVRLACLQPHRSPRRSPRVERNPGVPSTLTMIGGVLVSLVVVHHATPRARYGLVAL